MAYETRENTGSLFRNKDKKEEKHPNAKGECKIGGIVYEVAAWTKKDKNGNPWQSLSFKQKGEQYVGGLRKDAPKDDAEAPPF